MGLLSTPTRRLACGCAVTAAGVALLKGQDLGSSSTSSTTAGAFASLLCTSTFVGASVWTTFFSGIIMFKSLPKTTFGDLQAKLFPAYFSLQTATSAAALALAATGRDASSSSRPRAVAAGIALAFSLLNLTVLEPLTTAAMYRRREAQAVGSKFSEDDKKSANKKFGMLHGLSSLANLFALGAGVTVLWFSAEGMVGGGK